MVVLLLLFLFNYEHIWREQKNTITISNAKFNRLAIPKYNGNVYKLNIYHKKDTIQTVNKKLNKTDEVSKIKIFLKGVNQIYKHKNSVNHKTGTQCFNKVCNLIL